MQSLGFVFRSCWLRSRTGKKSEDDELEGWFGSMSSTDFGGQY